MKLLKTALAVTVISVFLQGCSNFRANLSSRDIDTTPLPMISAPWRLAQDAHVIINTVDKKPLHDVYYVNVDEGSHEVEYSCGTNSINGSGHVTIPVKLGMSYLLKGKLLKKTNTSNTTERVGSQTNVARDASGRLIQSQEPVYSNFERSSTSVVGCAAEVIVCDGYPYLDGNRVVCKKEPIGTLKTILFKGGESNYKELF